MERQESAPADSRFAGASDVRRRSRTATEQFWDFLSDIAILPLARGDRLSPAQARVHEPRVAERPRRRVPGRSRCAGRRSSPRTSRASVSTRSSRRAAATSSGSSSPTARSRGARTRRSSRRPLVLTFVDMTLALVVFVWALTQGVLPSLDALGAPAVLRLLVGLRRGRDPPRRGDRRSSRSSPGRAWLLHHFWNRLRDRASHRRSPSSTRRRGTPARSSSGSSPTGASGSRRSGSSSARSASSRASATRSSPRRR